MRMRQRLLMYAFAVVVWLAYVSFRMLSVAAADRNPNPAAFVYCLVLVGALPGALGYLLLFKALPWAGRLLRRPS